MRSRIQSIIVTTLTLLLPQAAFAQDSANLKSELGELQEDVKAAVIAELIPRQDARAFYRMLSELLYRTRGFSGDDKEGQEKLDAARARGGMTYTQFDFDLDSSRLDVLLTPEFNRRDIDFLSDATPEDETALEVSETLLEDYVEAYDELRRRVTESLASIRMRNEVVEASEILNQIRNRRIDWPQVDAKVEGWLSRGDKEGDSDAAREKMMGWLERRIVHLDTTIGRYEQLVASQEEKLAALPDGLVDGDPLVIVERARADRRELRGSLENGLATIGGGIMSDSIKQGLDRIRIDHGRRSLRFAGSDIDFWAILAGFELDAMLESKCLDVIREEASVIADLMDRKTDAAIDREILVTAMSMPGTDADERDRIRERVAEAARREIRTDLQIRELTQATANTVTDLLDDSSSDLGSEFRRRCLSSAFPSQMRSRWTEQALDESLVLPNIDASTLEALIDLDTSMTAELAMLRQQAVMTRQRDEPVIADAMLEMLEGDEKTIKNLGDMTWREPEYEAFDRFEDRHEAMLKSILGPERFALITPRPASKSLFGEKAGSDGKRNAGNGSGRKGSGGAGKQGRKGRK